MILCAIFKLHGEDWNSGVTRSANFASCRWPLQHGVRKPNDKWTIADMEWIDEFSIFHLVSLSYFYVLPLFNVNPFPDVCDDHSQGRKKIDVGRNIAYLLQLCNTESCGQTARKWINLVYMELIEKSYMFPLVWLNFTSECRIFNS